MIKVVELAVIGAMALTPAIKAHPFQFHAPAHVQTQRLAQMETLANDAEKLEIYYSPLSSTKVASYVGLGMAYHMAIIYTDHTGQSFGVSSGPSNLSAPQTPSDAVSAIFHAAYNEPSSFGTLVSDPHNNTGFVKGQPGDYYTRDGDGRLYPHSLVKRAKNLSAQWSSIVRTYAKVGALGLTYSPMNQNSNSLAGTALRRVGLDVQFSSDTVFAPGAFTVLPEA